MTGRSRLAKVFGAIALCTRTVTRAHLLGRSRRDRAVGDSKCLLLCLPKYRSARKGRGKGSRIFTSFLKTCTDMGSLYRHVFPTVVAVIAVVLGRLNLKTGWRGTSPTAVINRF